MKKIFILLALLCTSLTLSAGPIGEARARQIAEEFFSQYATRSAGGAITLNWAGDTILEPIATGSQLDTALMYIYSRGTNDGFVIVAGDSNISPIIAYSFDSSIDTNDMADATRDILDAWCKQINAARKEQRPLSSPRSVTRNTNELLYDTALWNQGEPYNREAPILDGNRSVTGCVATAMSIICYHNRWPDCGVGTTPEYRYYDSYGEIRTIPENHLGRYYDYDNMLLDYNNGYTEEQGNAVAALMKDMGTSVYMNYHYTGSGADAYEVQALCNYFKYSKEATLLCKDNYDIGTWNEMMRANLRECGPTYYSGGGNNGGHAFVIDGYSYNDYFHINYGWGGIANAWYVLPDIDYYARQAAIFNLVPDREGITKYRDNIFLGQYYTETFTWQGIFTDAQEYIVGQPFFPYLGVLYNRGGRIFNGDIILVHCDKEGEWKELLCTWSVENMGVNSPWGLDTAEGVTINNPIEEGDTIQAFLRSYDSDEWIRIRSWGGYAAEEVLLCATPEQIAEGLSFHYDKEQQVIFLESINAMQAELYRPSGETTTVHERAHSYIWYQIFEKGEHTLKIRSGGRPYELRLEF